MAEIDHCRMLAKVRDFSYVVPETFSSALILLLTEVSIHCSFYFVPP